MTTNGAINEDSDMAECDGEKVVTMMDVLQEQQDFEDDANAVLGASDEKNCTYVKGYIKRQAIYACLTCCTEAKDDPTKRAGFCLACSLNCHENHDLIELYTKRNFRCDCGNPKFNSHPCQFTPDKSVLNDDNKYNQNFIGLYCNCHRPYPDPESTVEDDEMIQCVICEDWLHASHLEAAVPGNDQYSEMVCKACMENNEFLHDYSNLAVNIETGDVDVVAVNGDTKLSNGDFETEKLMNGSGDTNQISKNNITLDEPQNENKCSASETPKTVENEDSEKPVEENESNDAQGPLDADVARDDEKTDDPTQISSDSNPKVEDDTNTVTALEESTKMADNTLEQESSVLQEQEENRPENLETKSKDSAEATPQTDDTKEEVNIEKNISEKSEQNSDKHTENKDQLPKLKTEKGNEIPKLDSMDVESKEEVGQTATENEDPSEDTKTTCADDTKQPNENTSNTTSSDIKSKESAEKSAGKSDVADEENIMNKVNGNIEDTENTSNATPEQEINDGSSKAESNETSKDVNTDNSSENQIVPNETEKEEKKENKRKLSTEEDTDVALLKKPKLDEKSKCSRPRGGKRVHKGATFWPSNFRQKLCTCNECLSMYKDLSVLFLLDPEDTVIAYETLGKERVDGRVTQYEKGLEALSSLDRIQQINALTEYNKMKDKLLDFLKSFKDRKEVVKEEDIRAFFAGMKPKREPDGVYFCR